MKYKFNIPNKISVGFQNRNDTYTGKLAYVIYTDDKGVLRKEKSWNSWRDNKIKSQELENVPTEGFVLNKKVGETRWGWNPRKAWVRVYDPRGFEFEISVANLVFILEECSSLKGKGLEGEFMYAWDRAELLLLPVVSQEYKDSVAFKQACVDKVTKKDMKEGYCYLNKENEELIYLGRLAYWHFYRKDNELEFKNQKKHIFVKSDGSYCIENGFTGILAKLGDEPSPLYPERFEEYKKSKYGSGPAKLEPGKRNSGYYKIDFVKGNGEFYHARERGYGHYKNISERATDPVKIVPGKSVIVPLETTDHDKITRGQKMSLCVVNESGTKINIGDYYYG